MSEKLRSTLANHFPSRTIGPAHSEAPGTASGAVGEKMRIADVLDRHCEVATETFPRHPRIRHVVHFLPVPKHLPVACERPDHHLESLLRYEHGNLDVAPQPEHAARRKSGGRILAGQIHAGPVARGNFFVCKRCHVRARRIHASVLLEPRAEVSGELLLQLRILVRALAKRIGGGLETRHAIKAVRRSPRLNVSAAVRRMDDADGTLERLLQFLAKVVTHRRELARRLRRSHRPSALAIFRRLPRTGLLHEELPQHRIRRARDLRIRIRRGSQGQLHVRLPRREPHLAGHHVVNDDLIFALDDHLERPLRRVLEIQRSLPTARSIGHGFSGCRADRHPDFLTRIRLAPHGHHLRFHQHEMVGENRGQPHLRAQRVRQSQKQTNECTDSAETHDGW